MAAQVTVRWIESGELRLGGIDDLARARTGEGAVWVDVLSPDAAGLSPIGAAFGLHQLALEDCLHFPQRVKIDHYDDHAFIVWGFPRHGAGSLIGVVELDVFLGSGFLVTSHAEPIPVVDSLATDAASLLGRGADWTLHALLDRGVDDAFPIVDHLSERLDELEDVLLDDPVEEDLQRLYALKRALITVYRMVAGERDVLRSMARRQEFVSTEAYMYYQDVGDHLARLTDTIDTYRDVASGAMDIYLSAVNNRLNDVMKRLTIVATVFMPLTLLSGIYGMNVLGPSQRWGMWPPPDATWSFWLVVGSMVAIAASMLVYFKWRRWW